MYPGSRIKNYDKLNQAMRWQLTDRVFFACGACHILAYAFFKHYNLENMKAIWIKPYVGYTGNHVFISNGTCVFDYHGYSEYSKFIEHTFKRAQHYWPGWNADLVELPIDVLISEKSSKTYDGLWLREPTQFLHDALPRAQTYLKKFIAPTLLSKN